MRRDEAEQCKGEFAVSTPAENMVAAEPGMERRFYPRAIPQALISVAFAEDNPGMLLNVSENGLLVSTPTALERNFVCRVSVALNGLARPVEVCARVVWTTESNRAGLQLLDLCEHDRERIRKWAALEKAPSAATEKAGSSGSDARQEQLVRHARSAGRATLSRFLLMAAGVAVVVMLAMGLALQGSPLHAWLTHSFRAGLKNSAAMGANANAAKQPVGVHAPGGPGSVRGQGEGRSASIVASTGGDGIGAGPGGSGVGEKTPAPEKAMASNSGSGEASGKKSAPRANLTAGEKPAAAALVKKDFRARADTRGSEGTQVAPSSTDAETSHADSAPSQEAAEPAQKQKDTGGRAPGAPAGATSVAGDEDATPPRPTEEPVNAGAASGKVSANPPALQPTPTGASATIERINPPRVVPTEAPQSRVLSVTVPNSAKPSLLDVPGENVLEASTATLHIQRSILLPASRGWGGEGKERVVLGDLLARVDPQPPRQTQGTGARVSVRALLGKDGRVEKLMPVNGPVALVSSAVRAVREWQFAPTLLDGKRVETEAYVLIEFRTQTDHTKP